MGLEPMKQQHSIGTPVRCSDVGDRLDVADHGAGGTVGADAQSRVAEFGRQPLDVSHDVRPGSGQSDVGRVDPDAIEQVEDVQLLLDRGRTRPTETAARRATSRRRA
jgi:hypothetical protein